MCCDIIYHRYQILKFLQPDNKHKPLIDAYNSIKANDHLSTFAKEKIEYEVDLVLYLLQVFARAEDESNFNKYLKKYIDLLNLLSKDDKIFYINKILLMIKLIVKSTQNCTNPGKIYYACFEYLNQIEKFYSEFFELTPDVLNNKLNTLNFIFSDFYYCAAHLLKNINIDDSVVSMMIANRIYYHKLGALSKSFKETSIFIDDNVDKSNIKSPDGETK